MKRFTHTEKWQPWFTKLHNDHKVFWFFLCDMCDNAGVWERHDAIAKVFISADLDIDEAIKAINNGKERIKLLRGGEKLHLADYIKAQVTTLKRYDQNGKINKAHIPYYRDLEKHGLDFTIYEIDASNGSTDGLQTIQEKEKDKVKDKVKDKDFGDSKEPFGDHGKVMLTPAEHEKLLVKLGERKTADLIQRLENYIGSKGVKYKSHYHTILSWAGNEPMTDGLNLNKKQQKNLEALRDFAERK